MHIGLHLHKTYVNDARKLDVAVFSPADIRLSGLAFDRDFVLASQLEAVNGVPHIQLISLNGVSLIILGGVLSNIINGDIDTIFAQQPVALRQLVVREGEIQIFTTRNREQAPLIPSATATSTRRPQLVNTSGLEVETRSLANGANETLPPEVSDDSVAKLTPDTEPEIATPTMAVILAPIPTPTRKALASPNTPTPTALPVSANLAGHIVYSIFDSGQNTYHILMRNADGSNPIYVYQGATQPDFCLKPANRVIANGLRAGVEGTIAIDLGVGDREVVPNTLDTLPACSPEGKRVLFQSARQGSDFIWIHSDINVRDDQASYTFYAGQYPSWSSRWQIVWRGCDYWAGSGANCGIWQSPDRRGASSAIVARGQ